MAKKPDTQASIEDMWDQFARSPAMRSITAQGELSAKDVVKFRTSFFAGAAGMYALISDVFDAEETTGEDACRFQQRIEEELTLFVTMREAEMAAEGPAGQGGKH